MKRLLLASVLSLCAVGAQAQVIDDPLHSVVCGAGGTGCTNTDNGSFAPLNSSANWGFEISPPLPAATTGTLFLGFLVPTNSINVATFNLPTLSDNGGGAIGETVISRTTLLTAATGSNLSSYLNLGTGFSPTDNFSNASAGESTENPGFTGSFLAFTASISGIHLDAQGSTTIANDFSFGSNLPQGTVIVGFYSFLDSNNVLQKVGTAASGDLVITPTSVPSVPEPATWGMMILGFMGLAFAFRQRRRKISLA